MITEDYVSFYVAKLLKEKGFGGDCFSMYVTPKPHSGMGNPNEAKIAPHGRDSHYYEGYEYQCEAPTLQMVMKWLREVHNLHCSVDYDYVLGWYCQITSLKETVKYDYEEMKHYYPDKHFGFSSPEEACEEAIRYTLENLI